MSEKSCIDQKLDLASNQFASQLQFRMTMSMYVVLLNVSWTIETHSMKSHRLAQWIEPSMPKEWGALQSFWSSLWCWGGILGKSSLASRLSQWERWDAAPVSAIEGEISSTDYTVENRVQRRKFSTVSFVYNLHSTVYQTFR